MDIHECVPVWDQFGNSSELFWCHFGLIFVSLRHIYYPQLMCPFACPPSESVFGGFPRLEKCCYLQQMVSRACLDGAGTFEIVYVAGSCGDEKLMKYNETP